MATVNIGNLTFTHRGDYAGGTAYAKNDVVYYATNGNAYIAKQATTGNAPTNATYWSQFAQGSGGIWNAGLSLGSASQKLRVNSGGNALEFYTETPVTSDFVKIASGSHSGTQFVMDNIFADETTYRNYKVFINYAYPSNALYMRGRTGGASGSNYSGNDYRYRSYMRGWNSNGSDHDTGEAGWNHNYFRIGYTNTTQQNGDNYELTFVNPNNTTHKLAYHSDNLFTEDSRVAAAFGAGYCNAGTGTVFTGLEFTSASGSSFTCEYAVYGMKQ